MKLSAPARFFVLFLLLSASRTRAAEPAVINADRPARVIRSAAPIYPYLMRGGGATGEVTVSFTVSAKGVVIRPSIDASDNPELDTPVLAAIKKWTFTPATRNGQAVDSKVQQTFTFVVSGPANTSVERTRTADAGSR